MRCVTPNCVPTCLDTSAEILTPPCAGLALHTERRMHGVAGNARRSNSRWTVMGNVRADCPCCLAVRRAAAPVRLAA